MSRGNGLSDDGWLGEERPSADYWGMGCPQAENATGNFQFDFDPEGGSNNDYCGGATDDTPWQNGDGIFGNDDLLRSAVPCLTNGDCPVGLSCCPIGICAPDLNSCFEINSQRSNKPQRSDI